MDLAHRPTKVLITGKSGSGKSTYYTRFVQNTEAKRFIFDHEGEFAFRTGLKAATGARELLDRVSRPYVIFDPVEMFPGDTEAGFAFFCQWSFEMGSRLPGTKLFACDELQKLGGTNTVPWELALLLETGRRHSIDTVFIAQQPNLIHNRIRNQLTEVVSFAQLDDNAIHFLADVGFKEDELRALQPGQYVVRNLNSGAESRGRIF
jgi:GTPase SAR1 family protein